MTLGVIEYLYLTNAKRITLSYSFIYCFLIHCKTDLRKSLGHFCPWKMKLNSFIDTCVTVTMTQLRQKVG